MSRKITSGTVSFAAGDNLTTEKKTAAIALPSDTKIEENNLFKIIINKPVEDTAGDLTIVVYDVDKTDGTNSRDVVLTTLTAEKVTGVASYKAFLVQGMFLNTEAKAKLGMYFAADSGAVDIPYSIYKL